jgi:hypothetical protein
MVALRLIAIQKYTLWAEFLTLSVVLHSVTTERWGVKHHAVKTCNGIEIKFHVFFIRILNWPAWYCHRVTTQLQLIKIIIIIINSAVHPGIFSLMKQPLEPRD